MAKKSGGQRLQKPEFFRVLLPHFSSKLPLPAAFAKKHISGKHKKGTEATLLSPTGKAWFVSLDTDDSESKDTYYFGEGWQECAQAHNLCMGYFLLFRYEGSNPMLFSFTVYDLSACEKSYPSPFASSAAVAQRQGTYYCEDRNCFCFEVTIGHYNLSRTYMYIPSGFMVSSGLSKEQDQVALRDPKGRTWPIRLYNRKKEEKRGYCTNMATGWRQFACKNQLKIGDRCIFELKRGDTELMRVQILRA